MRLGSRVQRLRGALRAQTVLDGQALEPATPNLEPGAEFGEELSEEEVERDMSNWKVSITSSDVRLDPTGKLEHSFTLAVCDGGNSSWAIERRPADFYALEAKLKEFHGEFSDNRLPSAGGILSTGLPTHPQVYEEFLDKLLKTESLRGSDLVHWFLACPVDFALEEGGLGRLLRRSVAPLSLRKERGQNIEPFIAAYISSTETKAKSTKLEWKEHTFELSPRKKRCLISTVFKNNLDWDLSEYPKVAQGLQPVTLPIIRGPTDAFIYLGSEVLKLPNALMKVSLSLIELFRPQLDSFCTSYFEKRLFSYFTPQRTAHLINLLQWAVFDKQGRSDPKEVLRALEHNISRLKGTWVLLYQTLYKTLQDPMNNKQLFYTLLDILLEEVFPEKLKS